MTGARTEVGRENGGGLVVRWVRRGSNAPREGASAQQAKKAEGEGGGRRQRQELRAVVGGELEEGGGEGEVGVANEEQGEEGRRSGRALKKTAP
jgi:hypothetical protein